MNKKYQVIFANGEKRDLVCSASEIEVKDAVVRLVDENDRTVAVIPLDKLLYIRETKS